VSALAPRSPFFNTTLVRGWDSCPEDRRRWRGRLRADRTLAPGCGGLRWQCRTLWSMAQGARRGRPLTPACRTAVIKACASEVKKREAQWQDAPEDGAMVSYAAAIELNVARGQLALAERIGGPPPCSGQERRAQRGQGDTARLSRWSSSPWRLGLAITGWRGHHGHEPARRR
jgi:hypothetical protein